MITSVKFRDEWHDVRITHDGGYEPDTDAHVIDWEWADDAMNQIELTVDEEQSIQDQLEQFSYENY